MIRYAPRFLLAAAMAALLPVSAGALERAIYLISQTARGQAAEGRSEGPAVDGNGLLTTYNSNALNLVSPPFQSHREQIYLRDIDQVAAQLVSQSAEGQPGNRPGGLIVRSSSRRPPSTPAPRPR